MPRIRLTAPAGLLEVANTRAELAGQSLDEVYSEAIERYIESTKNASAGAVRSRLMIPRSSPEVLVEVPEELFERAEAAAQRQEKRRPVFYADALAYHLARSGAPAENALTQGHDLPSGAWRPAGPS